LIGIGLACTAFGAVSGIIGRVAPPEKRSWAFGISGAASSFGQFMMMPIEQQLISAVGWQNAFYILGGLIVLLMVPMAFYLREPRWSMRTVRSKAFARRPAKRWATAPSCSWWPAISSAASRWCSSACTCRPT
jgi:predicted MFS family arabinose efflux permease